jgi:hypothetical protein
MHTIRPLSDALMVMPRSATAKPATSSRHPQQAPHTQGGACTRPLQSPWATTSCSHAAGRPAAAMAAASAPSAAGSTSASARRSPPPPTPPLPHAGPVARRGPYPAAAVLVRARTLTGARLHRAAPPSPPPRPFRRPPRRTRAFAPFAPPDAARPAAPSRRWSFAAPQAAAAAAEDPAAGAASGASPRRAAAAAASPRSPRAPRAELHRIAEVRRGPKTAAPRPDRRDQHPRRGQSAATGRRRSPGAGSLDTRSARPRGAPRPRRGGRRRRRPPRQFAMVRTLSAAACFGPV